MEIVRIGLDLAKNVFEVCGVDMRDAVVLRKTLRRDAVPQFFAELPPCLVGMEACSSSHYWAKFLTDLGHQVRLIAPQFVTPYVKSNKNDRNDAEAICEAISRPSMRFVPPKSSEQLEIQAVIVSDNVWCPAAPGLLTRYAGCWRNMALSLVETSRDFAVRYRK